jgi:protein phosphatase
VIVLLLALKICHPSQVVLLRGNHEDAQVNAIYGFRAECMRRCREGAMVWAAVNAVFEMMPVGALIDKTVLCVHGGLGESLHTLQQLRELPRPTKVDLSTKT